MKKKTIFDALHNLCDLSECRRRRRQEPVIVCYIREAQPITAIYGLLQPLSMVTFGLVTDITATKEN